jgi:hypothetical protein
MKLPNRNPFDQEDRGYNFERDNTVGKHTHVKRLTRCRIYRLGALQPDDINNRWIRRHAIARRRILDFLIDVMLAYLNYAALGLRSRRYLLKVHTRKKLSIENVNRKLIFFRSI